MTSQPDEEVVVRERTYPEALGPRPTKGKLEFFRLLGTRRMALQLELAEAAILRCEAIAERLGTQEDSAGMLALMRREAALHPYLDQSPEDPVLALALAKGDIAHYRGLRTSNWRTASLKPIVTGLAVPSVLILLAAVLGQAIGVSLQNRSFQQQRMFDLKRDRIIHGQERAVDLFNDLEQLQSSLSIRERDGVLMVSDQSDVRHYSGRIEGLRALSEGLPGNKQVDQALVNAGEELSKYAACLQTKGFNAPGPPTCAEGFELEEFRTIIYAFSDALIEFMSASG